MNAFMLTISSPDGNLFKGKAVKLSLRGIGGDLAILPRHVSFVTAALPGEIRILLPDGSETHFRIDGGILTVSPSSAELLTSTMATI